MMPWYLHPAFRPARLQDLVLWVNSSSIFGTTWQNLAPRYSNVNHGRIVGAHAGELLHPSGKFGSALSFLGDDYVDCGNDESLNITDAITIEAWVNAETIPTGNAIEQLVTKQCAYVLSWDHISTGGTAFWIYDGSWHNSGSGITPSSNVWHHLVGIYDGNNISLYIDGALASSEPIGSTTIATNANNLYIGSGVLTSYFNGTIDEVRIYAGALSGAEVMHNYTHSPIYYMQRGIDPLELLAMSPKEISRVVA